MQIIDKDLSEIKPYENNPRQNDNAVDAVANSIKEFGFKVPIVIDSDFVIVTGHTRYKASQKLGLPSVPCIVADDLTDEQIKAFRVADNKTAELADWDYDMLAREVSEILECDIDMSKYGFSQDEIDGILDTGEHKFDADDVDVEVPIPEEPFSKKGDLWLLGSHRVLCGDATNQADMEHLMQGETADLLLTDPPYNVNYEGKTEDSLRIQNDDMNDSDFRAFLVASFAAADSVLKPGGTFYIWHADSEGYNFRGACSDVDWKVRQCLIWNKNCMVLGRQDYQWKHEPCLYGWKDGASHFWASDRKQTTVLEFDKPQVSSIHPTMKPIALMSYLVGNSSEKNGIVLDMFGGSGSTLIACEDIGRVCRMMELDERYVDAIVERFRQFVGEDDIYLIRDNEKIPYCEIKK